MPIIFPKKCEPCQRYVGKLNKPVVPLQLVTVQYPFQQWGLYFFSPITPPSVLQHMYILNTMDYFTWWVEEIPLKVANINSVISFLESNILTRFGVPKYLVFDNSSYFNSIDLTQYTLENGIKVKYYANYYPHGNGLAESSNKNLINILIKTTADNHRDWHTNLFNSLWAD